MKKFSTTRALSTRAGAYFLALTVLAACGDNKPAQTSATSRADNAGASAGGQNPNANSGAANNPAPTNPAGGVSGGAPGGASAPSNGGPTVSNPSAPPATPVAPPPPAPNLPAPGSASGDVAEGNDTDTLPDFSGDSAAPEVGPVPSPEVAGPANTIRINPTSLRELLLSQNNNLRQALNRLHASKDQLNYARASLLPSLNLGALIYTGGSPNFLVSFVDFLLPFLIPGSWFESFRAKNQFEADRVGFRVLRLDGYASAYSLYHSILLDTAVRDFTQLNVDDLTQVEAVVRARDSVGAAAPGDFNDVHGRRVSAEVAVSKLNGLLAQERAQLRYALALDINKAIVLDPDTVPASDLEDLSVQDAIARVNQRAPEFLQLDYLLKAAKWEKWSRAFAFVNSATAGAQAGGGGGNVSFSNLTAGYGLNFGFAQFPAYKLSQRNYRDIELRQDDLRDEFTRLVDSTQLQFHEAQRRIGQSEDARQSLERVYRARLLAYQAGTQTLFEVLDARARMRDAETEKARADADSNFLRITLNRADVSDQFDYIQSCVPLPSRLMKKPGWFGKRPRRAEYPANGCHQSTVYGFPKDWK